MPALYASIVNAERGVWYYQFLVDAYYMSEALTGRTGTKRRVEREHIVVWLLEGYAVGLKTDGEVEWLITWKDNETTFSIALIESSLSRVDESRLPWFHR